MFKSYKNLDLGILAIRLALAAVFIYHGWAKAANISGTTSFFADLGLGEFWVYLVTAVELLGGIAMLLGIFTDLAGVLLAIVMLVAIFFLIPKGFTGWEFNLTLLLMAIAVVLMGPGKCKINSYPKKG